MSRKLWVTGFLLLYSCCFPSLGWTGYTNSKLVTLAISATDNGSGMGAGAEMMFSNDGQNWSTPEAFATVRAGWDLTTYGGGTGDGTKTVYLKLKDVAGNWSTEQITANIILELDTDGDGMPDWWEGDYGLDPNKDDANQDNDQDGYTNLEEYQAGWNPTHDAVTIYVDDDASSGGDGTAGSPFNDIQQGIEQAIDADTILVLAGNYIESQALFMKERVDLVSESGYQCTIDLNGSAYIEGANYSTISGFKIINSLNNIGAISCWGTSPMIYNNVIIPSTDTATGILLTDSSSAKIINNTIVDAQIGIEIDSASPEIMNNIIVNNTLGIMVYTGSPTINYNNVWGNVGTESCPSGNYCGSTPGEQDISADPLFVGGGDYHLTTGSPCIDAGTASEAPSDDIDGDTRPQGLGYDMGADEYIDSTCTDMDSDGYYAQAGCGTEVDCDDSSPDTYPGATELCDGIDNDCDSGTADGVDEAWLGTACDGSDSDLCEEGGLECVAGTQSCSDTTGNDLEVCDGDDNDCDGEVDEGVPDTDNDGICDDMDTDDDDDGFYDADDNCPLIANPVQEDTDLDSVGNVCDNCPDDANTAQSDLDEDGIGDVCDVEDTMLTTLGSGVVLDFYVINPTLKVSLIFNEVIESGHTSVNVSDTGPALDGFEVVESYYDIETSAIFSGVAEVCIYYDDTGMTATKEQNLTLFHFENNAWVDVTTYLDTVNNEICGQVTSFSPFVIGTYNSGGSDSSSEPANNYNAGTGDEAGGGGGGGCFIATAAYGTPMAKEVRILCRFRDVHLLPNPLGRKLVSIYYKISPSLTRYIKSSPFLKAALRIMLKPVVWLVQNLFIKPVNGEIPEQAVCDETITDGSASKDQPTRVKSYPKISSLKTKPSIGTQLNKPSASVSIRLADTSKKIKRKNHNVFFGYLRLVGTTVIGHDVLKNKAIIEDLLTSRQKSYGVGSAIPYGAKIIWIHEKRITLEKEGVRKQLAIADELGNPDDIAVLKAKGYKKVAEKEWLIRPNRLMGNTKNILKLLTQVSISPYINAGRTGGFKVSGIEQGAVAKKLGLNEEDIISTVNDKTIDNLDKVYELYQQIRKEPVIKLGLKRQQQEVTLAYYIIPDGKPKYSVKKALQSPLFAGILN